MAESRLTRAILAASAAAAVALSAAAAAGEPCRPAEIDPAMAEPPAAWRTALAELVTASSDPDQPWGCPDSRLLLSVPEGERYAWLSVAAADGRSAKRMVDGPADLVPVGKALLARLDPPLAGAPVAPAAKAQARIDPEPSAPTVLPDRTDEPAGDDAPRAYFDGQATARYAGATDGVMVGGALRATLPIQPWMAGLWGRYAALVHGFSSDLQELYVDELAVGLVGGYRLLEEPVRLDVGLTASLVILHMEGERPGPGATEDEQEAEAGKADGRVGTELRLGLPLSPSWHALATVDAELAPGALAGEESRKLDEVLPLMPAYTVGLSLGVEGAL